MVNWLLGIILFWVASALYFGGLQRDIVGGTGFRQFIGLLLTYAIFLVIWGVLYKVIGTDTAKGLLIASLVAALLLPLEVRLGFLLVGGRVRKSVAH
jgi:Na+-transporting NADH:ubiquinone oxidoreductase subunit NqrB